MENNFNVYYHHWTNLFFFFFWITKYWLDTLGKSEEENPPIPTCYSICLPPGKLPLKSNVCVASVSSFSYMLLLRRVPALTGPLQADKTVRCGLAAEMRVSAQSPIQLLSSANDCDVILSKSRCVFVHLIYPSSRIGMIVPTWHFWSTSTAAVWMGFVPVL